MIQEEEIFKIAYTSPKGKNTYEISNLGNMRLNGKKFYCKLGDDDYYGFGGRFFHREFARLWHPDFWPDCEVHHIDFSSKNNLMSNLQCLTHEEHSRIHKTGENHPMYGKHLSEETRKKISEKMSGENHPNFGKHHTEETRKRMSEANKGKTLSEETKRKISENHADMSGDKNPMYGKHLSEETRKKISEAHIGKHHTEETRKKMSEAHIGKKSSSAKHTERDVIQIKMLFKLGFDDKYIHSQFPQVSLYTIYDIRKGRSWKHVIV